MLNLTDLPEELLENMPTIERPSEPLYLITIDEMGQQGVVNDKAARIVFGDDWDLVLEQQHPGISAEQIHISIH